MTEIHVTGTPEQDIKKQIKSYLNDNGIYWIPTKGGPHTRAGDPDLIVCYRGYFVGIEAKTRTGRQHGQQKLRQKQIETNGGTYIIARSVGDVRESLEKIDKNQVKK